MEPDKPINNHIRTKIVIAFLAWIVCSTAQAADLSGVRRVVDARQISEAFPWGLAPSYLVRDKDRAYGHVFRRRVMAMGRLLDLARRFTLFDLGVKKIARYQQFFAVKNILARVKQREPDGRRLGGIIWHTQGSGKSLTMVMLARGLALDKEIKNARVVLVTDRIDLDDQLKRTFAACGFEPDNATSGRHLLTLVAQEKPSIIATVINKFDTALNMLSGLRPSRWFRNTGP